MIAPTTKPQSSAPLALQVAQAWAALAAAERVCQADRCDPDCTVRGALMRSAMADAEWYAVETGSAAA